MTTNFRFQNIKKFYKLIAISSFNAFMLFLILNLGAAIVLKVKLSENEYQKTQNTYVGLLPKLYSGMSEKEINILLHETGSRPYVYEPFVEYKNMPFAGKYVNVNAAGFRSSVPQGMWPPDNKNLNIFLFGGSTSFGWGISDEQTIATYLQKVLQAKSAKPVYVYNFGTEHYYSTQERILFEQLLIKNQIPDLAIFIDGMNEFAISTDDEINSELINQNFNQDRFKLTFSLNKILQALPVNKIIQNQLFKAERPAVTVINEASERERIITRYLKNKTMIESTGNALHVKTFFVWQPIPNYKVNLQSYLFSELLKPEYIGNFKLAPSGYDNMEKMNKSGEVGDNFINCAGIGETADFITYIDRLHYSPFFSERIAQCIASKINL